MAGLTTFLGKLGKALAEGIAVFTGLEPLIAPFFGSNTKAASTVTTVANDLTAVGQVVVQAEALIQGSGTGATKLTAATPLVVNIVKTSELVAHKTIQNETLFIQGCTDLTNAVAEILNALSPNSVNTTGTPLPAPPAPTAVPAPPLPASA